MKSVRRSLGNYSSNGGSNNEANTNRRHSTTGLQSDGPVTGHQQQQSSRSNRDSSSRRAGVSSASSPPTTIELRGVPIHFPFRPYTCQEDYMGVVLDALLRRENALLESPTGTGKTLCLLCATLAWQREEARKISDEILGENALATATAGDVAINHDGTTTRLNTLPNMMDTDPSSSSVPIPQQQQQQQPPRRVPTIIYASRTHSQLSQVVRELRNTRYRPKHAVLGAREQMCVNPKVKKSTSTAATINHDCSTLTKDRKCQYKNKLDGFIPPSNDSSSGGWFGTQAVMDMEDLLVMGNTHKVCPFYYTRGKVDNAELILVPYNYLFDKDARTSTLADIPWDNAVVIFDEAHNLESFASDSASFDLSSKDIAGCIAEVDKGITYLEMDPDRFGHIKRKNILQLKEMFLRLEEYIVRKLPITPAAYVGEKMMDIFTQGASITYNTHLLVLAEIKKVSDIFLEIRGGNTKGAPRLDHFVQCLKRVFGENSEARCLAKAQSYRVYVSPPEGPTNSNNNNNFGRNGTGGGRTISYWCFAPSEAMRELANLNVRSFLITSGTLSPLDSYALELDLPFPNRLENPHIIASDQIHVRVMGRGVSQKLLTSSYDRRQETEYYLELGNTLASLSRVIPGGMLVFFPSYGVMETSIEKWGGPAGSRSSSNKNNYGTATNFFAKRQTTAQNSSTGSSGRYSFPQQHEQGSFSFTSDSRGNSNSTPWKRLLTHKAVVIEPRTSSDLPDAIEEFHKYLNMPKSKGVVLFGVCRGKISEGIDFAHDMCRAVIITGLPFAPSFDPKVKMKREFLDQNRAKESMKSSTNGGFGIDNNNNNEQKLLPNQKQENNCLSGHQWYTQQGRYKLNLNPFHPFFFSLALSC
jgi:regulator of telomere elongation helicase 1